MHIRSKMGAGKLRSYLEPVGAISHVRFPAVRISHLRGPWVGGTGQGASISPRDSQSP